MKNIILIPMIFIASISCKAQTVNLSTYTPSANDKSGKYYKDIDGNFDPFLGVWKNTTGSTTFKVELFKEVIPQGDSPFDYSYDTIQGKYYLIENEGSIDENIICIGENMVKVGYVIIAKSNDGVSMNGVIYDTCIPDNLNSTFGELKMDITATNTAHWTITRKGMKLVGMDYVIPTDIILTKQ
ncbi:DUF6705 family protein [Bizionia sp. KMM 8389]